MKKKNEKTEWSVGLPFKYCDCQTAALFTNSTRSVMSDYRRDQSDIIPTTYNENVSMIRILTNNPTEKFYSIWYFSLNSWCDCSIMKSCIKADDPPFLCTGSIDMAFTQHYYCGISEMQTMTGMPITPPGNFTNHKRRFIPLNVYQTIMYIIKHTIHTWFWSIWTGIESN
jgi:hypothetical protein